MQIFLIKDAKNNIVHGSEAKKRTGCGINLQRTDNIGKYNVSGAVEDNFGIMTEVTCEKCQTYFTKRILKADRKEMNRMLKEEKKRSKTLGEDPNMVSLAEVQEQRLKKEKEEQRRAASKQAAPVETPAPQPVVQKTAPAPSNEAPELQFEQYTPPPKKPEPPTTTSYGGFALDNDLAQFALPKAEIDPTQAAFQANEGKNPNILAEQAAQARKEAEEAAAMQQAEEAAVPVLDDPDDIMAQFALPKAAPAISEEAAPEAEEPAAPVEESIDDIMAQFGVVPSSTVEEEEAPAPVDMDDIMAQFALPETEPETVQEETAAPVMDDVMAQFAMPEETVAEAEVIPEENPLDQFQLDTDVEEEGAMDEIADRLFGSMPVLEEAAEAVSEEAVLETTAEEVDPFAMLDQEMPALAPMQSAPVIEEVVAEVLDEEPVLEAADEEEIDVPMVEDIVLSVPEMPAPKPAAETEVPDLGDIILTVPESMAAPAETPAVEEIIPEVPVMAAPAETPAAEEIIPEVPVMTAPAAEVPVAPAVQPPMVQPVPQPVVQQPYAPQQPMMQNMAQPAMQQPMMQQPVPQFMGYDAQGQPVYGYAQPVVQQPVPQFMGYDAQGQPVYGYAQPVVQQPVAQPVPQPVVQQPVAQPAPQPVVQQPMAQPVPQQNIAAPVAPQPLNPEDFDTNLIEPINKMPKKSQGVRVSKIEQAEMPSIIRSAVQKSAAPKGNIFDQQDANVAALDSIEDILSMMGEDTSQFKKKDEPEVNLQFKEYKPKTKKAAAPKQPAPSAAPAPEVPQQMLSKEELKRQKREEKINAKFKKDLAKRGF